jgi:hypothetical protein
MRKKIRQESEEFYQGLFDLMPIGSGLMNHDEYRELRERYDDKIDSVKGCMEILGEFFSGFQSFNLSYRNSHKECRRVFQRLSQLFYSDIRTNEIDFVMDYKELVLNGIKNYKELRIKNNLDMIGNEKNDELKIDELKIDIENNEEFERYQDEKRKKSRNKHKRSYVPKTKEGKRPYGFLYCDEVFIAEIFGLLR